MLLCHEWFFDLCLMTIRRLAAGIQYRYSARQWLLLILLFYSLTPLFAQNVQEPVKSVRAMISGIVSYTTWPSLAGLPRLCIFSSARFANVLSNAGDSSPLPYLPVMVSDDQQALQSQCDGIYFGTETPASQETLASRYHPRALLLISEENPGCLGGSAFCLFMDEGGVRFTINQDVLSRSGIRVNPDVLMLARKNKDG